MTMKILLVDDHEIMREGMCALLKKQSDMKVVGQAPDGRTAMTLVNELHPDIVIMDIGMPNLNGIDAAHQMLSKYPNLKILAVTAYALEDQRPDILEAGCIEIIEKPVNDELLFTTMNKYL